MGVMVSLRLKPTKKILIVLGVAAVASLGLSYLAFSMESKVRLKLDADLKAKQSEAEQVESAQRQLADSEKELDELNYRIHFLRDVSEDEYQPSLLAEVTGLARQCGVNITTFSLQEGAMNAKSPVAKQFAPTGKGAKAAAEEKTTPDKEKGASTAEKKPAEGKGAGGKASAKKVASHQFLTISMTFEGTFHSVAQFVYRLAGITKIFSVDSLQVSPAPEGLANTVRVSAQATAYILKSVPPETAAAAALLQEILQAEENHKKAKQGYADLDALKAAGYIQVKENEVVEGYTFCSDPKKKPTPSTFKILALPKDGKLHSLSIDQAKKLLDDTDKVPYE